MPHGYKCDRCDDFVERSPAFSRDVYATDDGPPQATERVDVFDSADESVHGYTLCEDCREALVEWVEDTAPSPLTDCDDIDSFMGVPVVRQEGYDRPTPAEQTAAEIEKLRRQYDPSKSVFDSYRFL